MNKLELATIRSLFFKLLSVKYSSNHNVKIATTQVKQYNRIEIVRLTKAIYYTTIIRAQAISIRRKDFIDLCGIHLQIQALVSSSRNWSI